MAHGVYVNYISQWLSLFARLCDFAQALSPMTVQGAPRSHSGRIAAEDAVGQTLQQIPVHAQRLASGTQSHAVIDSNCGTLVVVHACYDKLISRHLTAQLCVNR